MRFRVFAAFLVASLVLSAGCDKNEPQQDKADIVPELELSGKIVVADPSGETCKMDFVLTDPDGSKFEAKCSDSWCHTFVFDAENGFVTFVVDPNTGQSSRVTSVEVIYGSVSKKFSVSQSGAGEDLDAIATMNFDISYQIDGPHVKMTVVPEFSYVNYYIAYSTKEEVEVLGDNIQAVIKANVESYISGEVEALVNYGGYTAEDALALYTGKGTRTIEMSLNGNTSWYGWCCAVSTDMKVISAVVLKPFTTGDVPPSDNVLSASVVDTNCDRVKLSVTATNSDQWAAIVLPASTVDGVSDKDLVAMFNSSDDVTDYLHFGDWSNTVTGLSAETDYYAIVFGYAYGAATTSLKKLPFRTLAYAGGASQFTLTLGKYTHYRANCTIESSQKTALYYTDLLIGDETVTDVIDYVDSQLEWMENNGYGNRASLMKVMGCRGNETVQKTDLDENTSYRFFAVTVDENTGEFLVQRDKNGNITSGVYTSDAFTTPAKKTSSAKAEVVYDKWFSGTEYAQHYPEDGAGASGLAVFPVTISKTDDVQDYWYCIYSGDLTDESQLSDQELIDYLIGFTYTDEDGYEATYEGDGIKNLDSYLFLCDFDKELTIVSVAYDNEDNWSKVSRKKIVFTQSGCSSWSDYPVQSSVAKQMSLVKSARK